MKRSRRRIMSIVALFLLGSTLLSCQLAGGEMPKDRTDLWNVSEHNRDIVLNYLRPALRATGGAGRLYVRSDCVWDSEDLLIFPQIELKPETNDRANVRALRDAFGKNKDVRVEERRPALVGIWIGSVTDDLLKTKIPVLKLRPRQRYNSLEAIRAIILTSEVQSKMRELRMDVFPTAVHYPILDPDPKLRHLPASIANVTMDEALDQVAQAFGGLVIYNECTGQNPTRWFTVDFARVVESAFKDSP
jgi:hypothetical protein